MKIGFDLISDLNLTSDNNFNWDNKPTSLYCLVAGNISSDLKTINGVLTKLSSVYQGVFYAPGPLEFSGVGNINKRMSDIERICKKIRKVALLHQHVVIIDGIAILGCTGWFDNDVDEITQSIYQINRLGDLVYLKNSIEKLQKHLDVKKIILVTNGVPNKELYFGEIPENYNFLPELTLTLNSDLESKVVVWGYGSYKKIVDATFGKINYVCNPYDDCLKNNYWAKRIEVEI